MVVSSFNIFTLCMCVIYVSGALWHADPVSIKSIQSTELNFTFAHENSFLEIQPSWKLKSENEFSFNFRTHQSNSLLAYHSIEAFPGYSLSVLLENAKVKVIHEFNYKKLSLILGKGLNKDNWHNVRVVLPPKSGNITVTLDDDIIKSLPLQSSNEPQADTIGNFFIYFGGIPSEKQALKYSANFVGCMGKIKISQSSSPSQFTKSTSLANLYEGCYDRCRGQTFCANDASCINHYNHYTCDCFGTGYEKRFCNDDALATITLYGNEYLTYRIFDWKDRVHSALNRISLHFKTFYDNSVLLYGSGTLPVNNYITAYLKNGKAVVTVNFGDGEKTVELGYNLINGAWRNLTINHRGRVVEAIVDSRDDWKGIMHWPEGSKHHLHFNPEIVIGGTLNQNQVIPEGISFFHMKPPLSSYPRDLSSFLLNHHAYDSEKKQENTQCEEWMSGRREQDLNQGYSEWKSLETNLNYVGSLRSIYYNDQNVLRKMVDGSDSVHHHGLFPIKYGVHEIMDIPLTFSSASSTLNIPYSEEEHMFALEFKTNKSNGIIMSSSTVGDKNAGYWEFGLSEGYFKFEVKHSSADEVDSVKGKEKLNDDIWHAIDLSYKDGLLHVIVDFNDEITKTFKENNVIQLDSITLGGSIHHQGFVGCMRRIALADSLIDTRELVIKPVPGISIDNCQLVDPCKRENACEHGGKCSILNNEVVCDCTGTGYVGKTCHFSIYNRSCEELYSSGYRKSGIYKIDIDRNGPFPPSLVFCNMDGKDVGTEENAIITKLIDHRMVRATLCINVKSDRTKLIMTRHIPVVATQDQIDQYRLELTNSFQVLAVVDDDVDQANSQLIKTMIDAAKKANPTCNKSQNKFSATTLSLINRRNDLIIRNSEDLLEKRDLNKTIHKRQRTETRAYNQRIVETTIKEGKGYKTAKKRLAIGNRQIASLKNADGVIVTDREEILRISERFYQALYTSSLNIQPTYSFSEDEEDPIPDITRIEVESAIKTLKCGKAAGEDGISSTLIQLYLSNLSSLASNLSPIIDNAELQILSHVIPKETLNAIISLSHNNMAMLSREIWNGVDNAGIRFNVTYRDMTEPMLKELIKSSRKCYQSIEYHCLSAPLFLGSYTWFRSPVSENAIYSIGSTKPGHCSCSDSGSCKKAVNGSTLPCNCDANSGKDDLDKGMNYVDETVGITEMFFLPPSELNSNSKSLISLGALECLSAANQKPAVTFKTEDSFIEVPDWQKGDLSFSFKTTAHDALLFYQSSQHSSVDYLLITLVGGNSIIFHFVIKDEARNVTLNLPKYINDINWHHVIVDYAEHHVRFSIDQISHFIDLSENENFGPFEGPVYIGGLPKHHFQKHKEIFFDLPHSFQGCLRGLVMNENDVALNKFIPADSNDIVNGCVESCKPNPCENETPCKELWSDYECDGIEKRDDIEKTLPTEKDLKIQSQNSSEGYLFRTDKSVISLSYKSKVIDPLLTSDIALTFRTYEKKALLLFANNYLDNFVQLHFENGNTVYFTFNHQRSVIRLENKIEGHFQGQTIKISVKREKDKTVLSVNDNSVSVDKPISKKVANSLCDSMPCKNKGICIEDFKNNAMSCVCSETSYEGQFCDKDVGGSFDGQNIIEFDVDELKKLPEIVEVELAFVTLQNLEKNTALLYLRRGKQIPFLLYLTSKGHLAVSEISSNQKVTSIRAVDGFNDGNRHWIKYIFKGGKIVSFKVNGKEFASSDNLYVTFSNSTKSSIEGTLSQSAIIIGGVQSDLQMLYENYEGCISNIMVKIDSEVKKPLHSLYGYEENKQQKSVKVNEQRCDKVTPVIIVPSETLTGPDWSPKPPVIRPYFLSSKSKQHTLVAKAPVTIIVLAVLLLCVIIAVIIYMYRLNRKEKKRQFEDDTAFFSNRSSPKKGPPGKDEIDEVQPLKHDNANDFSAKLFFTEMNPLRPSSSQELEWDPGAENDNLIYPSLMDMNPEAIEERASNEPYSVNSGSPTKHLPSAGEAPNKRYSTGSLPRPSSMHVPLGTISEVIEKSSDNEPPISKIDIDVDGEQPNSTVAASTESITVVEPISQSYSPALPPKKRLPPPLPPKKDDDVLSLSNPSCLCENNLDDYSLSSFSMSSPVYLSCEQLPLAELPVESSTENPTEPNTIPNNLGEFSSSESVINISLPDIQSNQQSDSDLPKQEQLCSNVAVNTAPKFDQTHYSNDSIDLPKMGSFSSISSSNSNKLNEDLVNAENVRLHEDSPHIDSSNTDLNQGEILTPSKTDKSTKPTSEVSPNAADKPDAFTPPDNSSKRTPFKKPFPFFNMRRKNKTPKAKKFSQAPSVCHPLSPNYNMPTVPTPMPSFLSNVKQYNNPLSYLGGPNIDYDSDGTSSRRSSIKSIVSLD
ncbi:Contactin-associated protein-like 3B [Nymphon striatum]|nr:Contactin-associated protein-like 3B [Nymphon striatum]